MPGRDQNNIGCDYYLFILFLIVIADRTLVIFFIVTVGTKNDKVIEREVMTSDGEKISKEFGLHFIETSSKYNEQVNEIFHLITSQVLLKKLQEKMEVDRFKVKGKLSKKKPSSC